MGIRVRDSFLKHQTSV